jgi:hypothetical protein
MYDQYMNRVSASDTNAIEQTKGQLRMIFAYLAAMKEAGVYDQSTIIITADHGARWTAGGPVEEPYLSALLVKSAGAPSAPLQFSLAPLAPGNIRATVLKAVGASNVESLPAIEDVPVDSTEPRHIYTRIEEPGKPRVWQCFEVIGDGNDFANWHLLWSFTEP